MWETSVGQARQLAKANGANQTLNREMSHRCDVQGGWIVHESAESCY